ncbi:MAG: hypothetical protein LUQ22_03530 [Methanotrichaceae archaeon]|nr:hypothetical protein [Methanotrichaceae archaeon]
MDYRYRVELRWGYVYSDMEINLETLSSDALPTASNVFAQAACQDMAENEGSRDSGGVLMIWSKKCLVGLVWP